MQKSLNSSHLARLEQNAEIFWRKAVPSKNETQSLKHLLEIYAAQEDWEKVITLSSKAVLHLNTHPKRTDFYHIWICALQESFDYPGLILLGKHLVKKSKKDYILLSLALIAFHFACFSLTSKKIFSYLEKSTNIKNQFILKAMGIYLANSKNKLSIKSGKKILKEICEHKNSDYFTWRIYLKILSDNNDMTTLSKAYQALHIKFPFAPEPYFVATLIAMDSGNWEEALLILHQIMIKNPQNRNSLFALAHCYLKKGSFLSGLALLKMYQDELTENLFDYHYLVGISLKKLLEKNFDLSLRNLCLEHLKKCMQINNFFGFSNTSIQKEIQELHSFTQYETLETQGNERQAS